MTADGDKILYGRPERSAPAVPEPLTLEDGERLALSDAALVLEEAGDEAERDGHESLATALHELGCQWKDFSVSRNDPPPAQTIADSLYENADFYADCLGEEWGDEAKDHIISIASRMSGETTTLQEVGL